MKNPSNTEASPPAARPLICEGNCEDTYGGHEGEVVRVSVRGTNVNWGEMSYCKNAIREDTSKGLIVTRITYDLQKHLRLLDHLEDFTSNPL